MLYINKCYQAKAIPIPLIYYYAFTVVIACILPRLDSRSEGTDILLQYIELRRTNNGVSCMLTNTVEISVQYLNTQEIYL